MLDKNGYEDVFLRIQDGIGWASLRSLGFECSIRIRLETCMSNLVCVWYLLQDILSFTKVLRHPTPHRHRRIVLTYYTFASSPCLQI